MDVHPGPHWIESIAIANSIIYIIYTVIIYNSNNKFKQSDFVLISYYYGMFALFAYTIFKHVNTTTLLPNVDYYLTVSIALVSLHFHKLTIKQILYFIYITDTDLDN